MRVITIASSKGGAGKSTLAAALAVEAVRRGETVALLDLDPQQTVVEWHGRRGAPENPAMREVSGSLAKGLDKIEANGFTLAILDTPPAHTKTIMSAIDVADLVVIPLRPSMLDIETAEIMVEMCQDADKPYAFAISAAPTQGSSVEQTADALADAGPVLRSVITARAAHVKAMSRGKSAGELDDTAQAEIAGLWKEVATLLPKVRT